MPRVATQAFTSNKLHSPVASHGCNLKVTFKAKSQSQPFMLHFYVLFAILFTLGLLRLVLSKSKSTLPTFLTVCLPGCLCFCVFVTFLNLWTVDTECVLALSNQFGLKDTVSTLLNNDPSVCFSPAEQKGHYCIEKSKYWGNLGGCTACLVVTNQIAFAILRRLQYTQEWVKKLTHGGLPKWLFSWVTSSNPGGCPEKGLFNSMVSILVINLLILYFVLFMF